MTLSLCPLRGALVARAQDALAPLPNTTSTSEGAVILSIRGERATLNIGVKNGAQVGAVYGVLRDGQVRASLRIIEVKDERSFAQILPSDRNANFAVGDAVRFIAISSATTLAPPDVEIKPPTVLTPTVPTPAFPTPAPTVETAPIRTEVTTKTPVSSAQITAVAGQNVTLDVGALQGLRLGANLPLLRGGAAIGVVRVQSLTPRTSQARVIWQDETIAAISVGDSVDIPRGALENVRNPVIIARNDASPGDGRAQSGFQSGAASDFDPNAARDAGFRPVTGSKTDATATPSVALRYETGASNIAVPRTDRTYESLTALAASGVISRYPASLFSDEGVRFHRTAEDLTLTRAQIADLVRESLENNSEDTVSSRDRLILSQLTQEFRPELRQLGVAAPVLAAFAPKKGFQLGISGQQRASFVSGDKTDFLVPFSERQGGTRTRSGFDSRTNLFGSAGNRTTFFATIDAGTQPGERRGGLGASDADKFRVRRANLNYNAGNLLRGLTLEAGRDEFWLGPGHFGTLLLGDAAGPLNRVGYNFKRGSLSVRGLYAPLDNGPNRTGVRSLYVRDTRFQIGSQAAIGFSESVFVPRDRFDPALFATVFSPIPLFITQRRGKKDAEETSNLLQSFYAEAGIARGVRTYGEIMVDDIGVNNENLALNRIGTLIGAHIFTPRNPAKLGAYGEFARLAGRSYLRFGNFDPDYDYYYRSRPLGYPVAPTPIPGIAGLPSLGGAESLRLEAYYQPVPKLRLTGGVELADLNSERLDLSRQQTLRFSAAYSFSQAISLNLRAQHVSTSQPNFVIGEPASKRKLLQVEVMRAF